MPRKTIKGEKSIILSGQFDRNRVDWTWEPMPSQEKVLLSPAYEIMSGGSRGGGKTDVGIIFMVKGNQAYGYPEQDEDGNPILVNISYIYHPRYTGLVIRKNANDHRDWIERAKYIYAPLGGEWSKSEMTFQFESGARIVVGHLAEDDSWEKYRGHEYQRINMEEITQIADEKQYLMLRSSCRSRYDELKCQIFLSTNPIGPGLCVPFGEVLTADRGWVDIREMKAGDRVISVTPDGTAITATVTDTVKQPYSGNMIRTEGQGLHMEFTENHRLPHLNTDQTSFTVKPFYDLPGQAMIKRNADDWRGTHCEKFTATPALSGETVKCHQPDEVPGDLYMQLMGWYLSSGLCVDKEKAFTISPTQPQHVAVIRELLCKCGFDFRESVKKETGVHVFYVHSEKWWAYLRQFGLSTDRFVPRQILNATKQQLKLFFDAAMDAGGRRGNAADGGVYFTTSKQLADDICEVVIKLGMTAYLRCRDHGVNREGGYEVHTAPGMPTCLNTGNHVYDVVTTKQIINCRRIAFSGEVYCITVPITETFFIRQNGCVWLSGNTWVRNRFVRVNDNRGERIQPETLFYVEKDARTEKESIYPVSSDPKEALKLQKKGKLTRVFIPMWLKDNRYLMSDESYIANLMELPPAERAAMLEGDWDAMSGGRYFEEFRERPLSTDQYPEFACHVTDPVELKPWWERWMGCDWGHAHKTAVYWACRNEDDKRIHVYREYVVSGVEPVELGARIAEKCEGDLLGLENQTMVMYLSKDAFDKRQGSTSPSTAEMIASGISEAFGPGGCLIPHLASEEQMDDFWSQGKRLQPRIVLRMVDASSGSRLAAAQYIRSLLRWWPVRTGEGAISFDAQIAEKIRREEGIEKYHKYMQRVHNEMEVLPKLKIWRAIAGQGGCPGIIQELQEIQRDPDNPEDYLDARKGKYDLYDGFRYCLYNHVVAQGAKMPKERWIEEKIRNVVGDSESDWRRILRARQAATAEWERKFSGGKYVPIPMGHRLRRR